MVGCTSGSGSRHLLFRSCPARLHLLVGGWSQISPPPPLADCTLPPLSRNHCLCLVTSLSPSLSLSPPSPILDSHLPWKSEPLSPDVGCPSGSGSRHRLFRSCPARLHLLVGEQLLSRNVERFRGGLVFQAHRLLNHSTLGSRVTKKKKKEKRTSAPVSALDRKSVV